MSKLTYTINGNEMIEKSVYDSLSAQNEINRCAAENGARRIAELEAKLAVAVEALEQIFDMGLSDGKGQALPPSVECSIAYEALAKIRGEK